MHSSLLCLPQQKVNHPYCIIIECLNSFSHILHRVDADLQVKVADFGLTRDIYATDYYRQSHQGRVPIKWMSIESLHDRISNEKTDVVS